MIIVIHYLEESVIDTSKLSQAFSFGNKNNDLDLYVDENEERNQPCRRSQSKNDLNKMISNENSFTPNKSKILSINTNHLRTIDINDGKTRNRKLNEINFCLLQ